MLQWLLRQQRRGCYRRSLIARRPRSAPVEDRTQLCIRVEVLSQWTDDTALGCSSTTLIGSSVDSFELMARDERVRGYQQRDSRLYTAKV
jgi:hypothetical protein